jgi:hypothetical protein
MLLGYAGSLLGDHFPDIITTRSRGYYVTHISHGLGIPGPTLTPFDLSVLPHLERIGPVASTLIRTPLISFRPLSRPFSLCPSSQPPTPALFLFHA